LERFQRILRCRRRDGNNDLDNGESDSYDDNANDGNDNVRGMCWLIDDDNGSNGDLILLYYGDSDDDIVLIGSYDVRYLQMMTIMI